MLRYLVIMDMQNHNRYHFILIRMAYNKKNKKITSVSKNVEKLEPLYIAGVNVKEYRHCRKSLSVP